MRQDRTVARILLIFSIANIVLAAPTLVRQRRLVTDRTDDEPTGEPEQDPAGLVHQVVPVEPPPFGGSPAAPEKWPEKWSEGEDPQLEETLLKWLDNLSDQPEDSAPNSPTGLHQGSVPGTEALHVALQSHDDLPVMSGGLLDRPSQWWQHTGSRPSTWEVGESSNSAGEPSQTVGELSQTAGEPSHTAPEAHEMLPPALEAQPLQMLPPTLESQPLHGNTPWWHGLDHELGSVTDMDQASTMSWLSKLSESEEEAKVPDETHLHP